MDADIKTFILDIKEQTGINFSIYSKSGELIAGDGDLKIDQIENLNQVSVDEKSAKTIFSINHKNKTLIGVIDGCGQTERNYAFLIKELMENSFFKELGLSKSDFLKATLMGEASSSQIAKYMQKYSIKDKPSFVTLIYIDDKHANEIKNILINCIEDMDFVVKIEEEQLAFVKFISEETSEYQSPADFAEFIKQTIYEEIGVSVTMAIGGTVKTISELSTSFNQASTAYRMHKLIGARGEIHSFKEFVLIKMLEELPKHKLNENLETLLDTGAKEIFSDQEMINTAEEFLENSLNTSETSRKLFLHRNTLIYRLDKIEKATGLNIRKFSDAITFRLITILSRLVR